MIFRANDRWRNPGIRITFLTVKPVSYTHLDVYKRQTKYVVALPVKKDEMLVDIYNKGNIDQIESASKHNSVKFFKEKQYAIPGEYNTTLGYNFTNVPLSSLYDFKPADAEFIFTLDQNNQNDKTKEQWDGNFKWNATKGTLTLSNTYEMANYNFHVSYTHLASYILRG